MNNSFLAPLLAVLLAWAIGLAPSAPDGRPEGGVASGALPQLVAAPPDIASVAEAGKCPQLGPLRGTNALRAWVPATGAARLPAARAGERPLPAGQAAASADHTPLYFGSLPPPA